ncbi:MAG: ferritin [Candidatus Dadabacteria bacterium]|nr:MAG: ferritin [Candidatus Dadabacteria bacterium]
MIGKRLADELNKQINIELFAAYQYFSMAAYCEAKSLDGFASWMKVQAQEELSHALKIYDYLIDRGATVTMLAIEQPKVKFNSVLDAFQTALKNEEDLGTRFNELSEIAREEKDNITYSFLKWFLDEQVEEVALVSSVIDKLKLIGDNGYGLLMLSNELGQRQPEPTAE